MKPLIILIIAFAVSAAATFFYRGSSNFVLSGNIAMFLMLVLTAIGHFKFTPGMIMMIPEFIPFKKEIVYATGIFEILLGAALLFPSIRQPAGIVLVVLFVILLPANINAAINHVNLETGSFNGPGPSYLWFRVPLQLLFIAWVIYFSIKN